MRESTFAFAMSPTNVIDWVRNWETFISISYPDFLEAIGRVCELIVIPSKAHLEMFGVDDIVQFYMLMERTNLWSTVGQAASNAETKLSIWKKLPNNKVKTDFFGLN